MVIGFVDDKRQQFTIVEKKSDVFHPTTQPPSTVYFLGALLMRLQFIIFCMMLADCDKITAL